MQYEQIKYIEVEDGFGVNYIVKFWFPEITVISVVGNISVFPLLCFHKWIFLFFLFSKQIYEAALIIALVM